MTKILLSQETFHDELLAIHNSTKVDVSLS